MEKSWQNIALALAGVVQCAIQVEELAKTGYLKTEPFETAVNSLLNQNPDSTEDVFGRVSALSLGLESLDLMLQNHRNPKHSDALRYILGMIHLQKRLARRKELLSVIGSRLEKTQHQVQHFGPTHDNVIGNIADIYTDTISKFPYRIQVTGEYTYLQQSRVASQIRTLLLAGIRAATLWRQVGGTRWQLLLYRSKLSRAVSTLRQQCAPD
ncbi:high frequency lysogenization protein HflD [Teredinibacter haidensis]|uniref:high frequency lysogenization protein HflD n=1 Tax=Teredinibacter haidensis TaxID=2731755 RepID=UPI000949107C|nr:high frequency lysogenization protein HflD [Teredinibacter haidensis]